MHRLTCRFALAWLVIVNVSLASKEAVRPLPVGSLVMAKRAGVHFRIKNKDVEVMHCGLIECVQKVQDEWLWLGRGWVQRRDVVSLPEAAKYFTAEIRRKPTPFAYVARAAAKGRDDGFTSETDSDIEQALKLDSEFAPAHYLRGTAFRERLQLDAAENAFVEATRCGLMADALNDLGRVWYDQVVANAALGPDWLRKGGPISKELTKLLLTHFEKAIRMSPRLAKAYRNRADIFLAVGEPERAFSDLQESLKHDPADSATHRLVGEYWETKGDDARALSAFDEAVRLNPKCGKGRFDRAKAYSRQGDDEKALADLNLAIQLLPRNAEALQARGLIYYRMGEIEKSRADRLAALRLVKEPSTTMFETKNCDANKSKPQKSATDQTWVKLIDDVSAPTDSVTNNDAPAKPKSTPAETPYSRARTLDVSARRCATSPDERYLNGERAVEAATQACELTEWKFADCIDTLASAYAEAGDFEAAVEWQTKAIELGTLAPALKAEAEKRLELYRAHKPCREDVPGRLARERNTGTLLR